MSIHNLYWRTISLFVVIAAIHVNAFTIQSPSPSRARSTTCYPTDNFAVENNLDFGRRRNSCLAMSQTNHRGNSLHKVPEDDDTAIAFVEVDDSSFIECYADSIAIINGVEYTIGSPCDHSVALCYFDEDEQLIPIELDEELMDDIFNIAARLVLSTR